MATEAARPRAELGGPADAATPRAEPSRPAEAASVRAELRLPDRVRFSQLPPLALYMHLPWCVRKCPYCDFNSHEVGASGQRPAHPEPGTAGPGPHAIPVTTPITTPVTTPFADSGHALDPALERRYVDCLRRDLESALPTIWGRPVHTVFLGGGTPSLFSPDAIDVLLSSVRALLPLVPAAEITLEANPGTVDVGRFEGFRQAGVNRVSIGVQSFDGRHLEALGRIHDARAARAAAEAAARHFDNFNLDLMYGLPGQRPADCERDIAFALEYEPPHLSVYNLTLEPNTVFAKYPPQLPDEDAIADMQDAIEARLAHAGFEHYEVSAHARPGRRCRHNLNYWQFGDYLGIGAGAHSKLSLPDRVLRQARYRQPGSYMDAAERGAPIAEAHEVAPRELPFEFMLNALRLTEGVPVTLFSERTGLDLAVVARRIGAAVADGLLDPDPMRIRPTPLGLRFLNDLQQRFLD
ncbi:MAG: oxygen-independent coproporphyrinogen III oxidase-like protein [Burkholderiales bacterium]|nr:MAG: oxygen-independent coproporphyrinogen III oxidase-like protein [Burkholderiales bacterium]